MLLFIEKVSAKAALTKCNKKRATAWYTCSILAIKTGWVVLTPGARIAVHQAAALQNHIRCKPRAMTAFFQKVLSGAPIPSQIRDNHRFATPQTQKPPKQLGNQVRQKSVIVSYLATYCRT